MRQLLPKSLIEMSTPVASAELPRANRAFVMPEFRLEAGLLPEHIDFFETFGFIKFKQFLPRERAARLYDALQEMTEDLVRRRITEFNGVPLVTGKRDDGKPYFGRIPFASLHHPEFRRYLQDPRFAEIIQVLAPGFRIGEEERDGLVVNRFRNEPGAKYSNLGWHTDSLRDLAYLEKPRRYLNVGFSITDSPLAVGGLRLLPCSHNQPISSMLLQKIHFMDMRPDINELAIETEAGDLTIHDGRLWHRTALSPNYGDASERCVMYLPLMDGPVVKKSASSKTPVYFHFKKLVGY
jgi:hypothetical protein